MHNASLEGMKSVLEGWARPLAVEGADGKIYQKNSVSGEMKPATQEQIDSYNDRKEKRIHLQKEDAKLDAETQKLKKDAATGSTSNLTGEDYLKTLPTTSKIEFAKSEKAVD